MGLRPVRRAAVPGYPSRDTALRAALRSLRGAALAGGASALLGLAGCGAAGNHHETSGTHGSSDDAAADGGASPSGSAGDEDLPLPPGEPPTASLPKATLGSPASASPSWVPLHRRGAQPWDPGVVGGAPVTRGPVRRESERGS